MSKQYRYTLMVPVEIRLDSPSQLRKVVRDIREFGPFPEASSYGEGCHSWRTRHDRARLKDVIPLDR